MKSCDNAVLSVFAFRTGGVGSKEIPEESPHGGREMGTDDFVGKETLWSFRILCSLSTYREQSNSSPLKMKHSDFSFSVCYVS